MRAAARTVTLRYFQHPGGCFLAMIGIHAWVARGQRDRIAAPNEAGTWVAASVKSPATPPLTDDGDLLGSYAE
jgi:hypothetical protein